MQITTLGLDLTKPNFPFVGYDRKFKEVRRKTMRRNQLTAFFERLPPCKVGMEHCAGSHYWGRHISSFGHDVRLIPTYYVADQLRDSNKGYFNDARVLAAASQMTSIPNVDVNSVEQQELHAIHRLQAQCIKDRTTLCNLTWKLLTEYGVQLPKGVAALRRHLPDLLTDGDDGLSERFRRLLAHRYEQLLELDQHLNFYADELASISREECHFLER